MKPNWPLCSLTADKQRERRFAAREEFAPFEWRTKKGQHAFRRFLRKLDEMMPFTKLSYLADRTMALRFFYASRGVIGYVVPIVRYAAEFAIEDGLEAMDLELLARAYAELKWERKLPHGNPFEAAPERMEEELMMPPSKPAEADDRGKGRATNRRVKGKQRVLTSAELLHT